MLGNIILKNARTYLFTQRWFQILSFNINSLSYTQLNGFKSCYLTRILFDGTHLNAHSYVTYSYTCRNIGNTIMTNETRFFRKTYFSLYSKGLRKGYCVRGELETEQNCNILTPSSSGYSSASFSSCGTAQPGALRVLLSAGSHCFELQAPTPNSDL